MVEPTTSKYPAVVVDIENEIRQIYPLTNRGDVNVRRLGGRHSVSSVYWDILNAYYQAATHDNQEVSHDKCWTVLLNAGWERTQKEKFIFFPHYRR